MLSRPDGFLRIVEVNPPDLPNMDHLLLEGAWNNVLVTDNVFGRIRVSPYAFAARITHDVPSVDPTVVVSTRDRNILAIESEVRGALGNGASHRSVIRSTSSSCANLRHRSGRTAGTWRSSNYTKDGVREGFSRGAEGDCPSREAKSEAHSSRGRNRDSRGQGGAEG